MTKYTLATIKKRAFGVGYRVEKGFQHYLYNGSVVTDYRGNRYRCYRVMNLSNGLYDIKKTVAQSRRVAVFSTVLWGYLHLFGSKQGKALHRKSAGAIFYFSNV